MKQQNYSRYFRVFLHDTAISEISTNNFLPAKTPPKKGLTLAPVSERFYGYTTREEAVAAAKQGARSYIDKLIAMGEPGEKALLQYRMDHYEDLNINLVQ